MNKNYIIISTLDWDANWQIPHELTKSLVKNKDRVLYIENTGVRSVMLSDLRRIYSRFTNFLKSARGFKRENNEFSIFSPLILPFPYLKFVLKFNKYFYINKIKKWIEINKFNETILICFLPTPINLELIKKIKFKKIIYYCLDNLSSGYNDSKKVAAYEKIFIKESDLNFFTSRKLKEKNYIKNKSFHLPAGVNLDNFKKKRQINKSKKKIIGYIGAISNVFDQDLLASIATKFKDYEIHIIGPIVVDIKKISNFKNIKFFKQIKHSQLQNLMLKFDLGIIPYKVNKFTDCVYPCKLNEYLAMGIPVVSTNILELRNKTVRDPKIFSLAKNINDFHNKISFEINKDNNRKIKNRIFYAKTNSWQERFRYFNVNINRIINKDNEITNKWIDIFVDQANTFKNTFLKRSAVFIFIYALIFHSSLFWHAGNYLRYFEEPVKAKSIIVFSGDGQNSYINNSYQQRALDAAEYYKKGLFTYIFLSSGREQTIPETKLIEAFLINAGIPEKQIFVQKYYPNTTYRNIKFVHEELKKKKIDKSLFITSPFHSRRAKLIWENFDDVEIIPVGPISDNFINKKFNMKLKDIKVILYEYLSIIFNKLKGNIS